MANPNYCTCNDIGLCPFCYDKGLTAQRSEGHASMKSPGEIAAEAFAGFRLIHPAYAVQVMERLIATERVQADALVVAVRRTADARVVLMRERCAQAVEAQGTPSHLPEARFHSRLCAAAIRTLEET